MWHSDIVIVCDRLLFLLVSPYFQVKSCPISVHWHCIVASSSRRPKRRADPRRWGSHKTCRCKYSRWHPLPVKGLAHIELRSNRTAQPRQCSAVLKKHLVNKDETKCHTWCLWKCPHMTATTRSMNCSDNLFGWTVGIPRFADLARKGERCVKSCALQKGIRIIRTFENIWKHVVICSNNWEIKWN